VLAKEWHLSKPDTGSIFSTYLFGLLIDNFGIPFLTQRFETKRMAFVATGLFGLFTVLNVFATSVQQLPSRFLIGIGLGAVTPRAVSLVSEFSAKRTRTTFVVLVYIGISLGFISAGFCSGARFQCSAGKDRCGWVTLRTGIDLLTCPITARSGGFLIEVRPSDRVLHATTRLFRSLAIREVSH